jgi:hypothetical protein
LGVALGDSIVKADGTDITKINEAMELTQISHLATKNITKSVTVNCKKY